MIDRQLNYGREIIKRFLIESMPFNEVLDLGAGAGRDLASAYEVNKECRLGGIEVCDENVKTLKEKNITVYDCNIEREKLPYEDQSADVIILNQILEHTKEVFWIFHEVARVLRVGGSLIIGVPNLASLHNRVLLLAGKQPSPIKNYSAHVRGFTKKDILSLIDLPFPEGFNLEGFGGSNFYPFPPVLAVPFSRIFPSLSWGIFLRMVKEKEYNGEYLEFPIKERLETNFFLGQV